EVLHRRLQVGVGLGVAEHATPLTLLGLGVGAMHGRVDHDGAGEVLAVEVGGGDGHEAAHRVPDDDREAVHPAVRGPGPDLVDPRLDGVDGPAVAVAVTGQVDGDDVVLHGQQRADEAPPVGVGGTAVDQHQAGSPGLTPRQVVDVRALHAGRR